MKKIKIEGKLCVACGTCVSVCPRNALYIQQGVHVVVTMQLCVGCGLCSKVCPADIMKVQDVAI